MYAFCGQQKKNFEENLGCKKSSYLFSAVAQLLIFRNFSCLKETYQLSERQDAPTPKYFKKLREILLLMFGRVIE